MLPKIFFSSLCRRKSGASFFVYRYLSYIQGQSPEPNTREYFYYIDHQGMLFLDDSKMKNFTSCFKDKKFLEFFFRRLRINNTGRYKEEFPFYSPCGREKNFVRCEDVPIVFTHLLEYKNNENVITDYLSYAHTGDLLKIEFQPDKICMHPVSGRVYHPGPVATGGIGLVKSSLAILLSQNFVYKNPNNIEDLPESFIWKDKKYTVDNEILKQLKCIPYKSL